MLRVIIAAPLFVMALCAAGCYGSGKPAAYSDTLFRRQNEQFELQHANHVKKSSDAVRDYLRHRNK